MCITLAVHRTNCETRRPVILNPLTGTTIFHPIEAPGACTHTATAQNGDCPSHGPCCILQKWQICLPTAQSCQGWQTYHQIYSSELSLTPEIPSYPPPAITELKLSQPEDLHAFTLRHDFYDAGAQLWQCATWGETIIKNVDAYMDQPYGSSLQAVHHIQAQDAWQKAVAKLVLLKQIWEVEAGHQDIELCPAVQMMDSIFFPFFQICREFRAGFPMLDGSQSFDVPDVLMIESFSSVERQNAEQQTDPEDLALTPTRATMSVPQMSRLRAEIDAMKERVAVLEAERLQAQQPGDHLPPLTDLDIFMRKLNNSDSVDGLARDGLFHHLLPVPDGSTSEPNLEGLELSDDHTSGEADGSEPMDVFDTPIKVESDGSDAESRNHFQEGMGWNGGSTASLTSPTPDSSQEQPCLLDEADRQFLNALDRSLLNDPQPLFFGE